VAVAVEVMLEVLEVLEDIEILTIAKRQVAVVLPKLL
jgi:hypothetical protein